MTRQKRTLSSYSNRSEYFRARYKARRNAERVCSYCKAKTTVDVWKAERCLACLKKFVLEVKRLFTEEGKTLKEIGELIDDKKKYTGERVRQLYKKLAPGGFTKEEINCHTTNVKKKRIEEKTSQKISDIVAVVKASSHTFTARRFSNEFECSWELGRLIVDYLVQWHKKEIGEKVIRYSKEEYLKTVRVDLVELSERGKG